MNKAIQLPGLERGSWLSAHPYVCSHSIPLTSQLPIPPFSKLFRSYFFVVFHVKLASFLKASLPLACPAGSFFFSLLSQLILIQWDPSCKILWHHPSAVVSSLVLIVLVGLDFTTLLSLQEQSQTHELNVPSLGGEKFSPCPAATLFSLTHISSLECWLLPKQAQLLLIMFLECTPCLLSIKPHLKYHTHETSSNLPLLEKHLVPSKAHCMYMFHLSWFIYGMNIYCSAIQVLWGKGQQLTISESSSASSWSTYLSIITRTIIIKCLPYCVQAF